MAKCLWKAKAGRERERTQGGAGAANTYLSGLDQESSPPQEHESKGAHPSSRPLRGAQGGVGPRNSLCSALPLVSGYSNTQKDPAGFYSRRAKPGGWPGPTSLNLLSNDTEAVLSSL